MGWGLLNDPLQTSKMLGILKVVLILYPRLYPRSSLAARRNYPNEQSPTYKPVSENNKFRPDPFQMVKIFGFKLNLQSRMGLALTEQRLAVSSRSTVVVAYRQISARRRHPLGSEVHRQPIGRTAHGNVTDQEQLVWGLLGRIQEQPELAAKPVPTQEPSLQKGA